jgi:Rieske Fe-S protein
MSEINDVELSQGPQMPQTRRALLLGAGVTCAAMLTGCTTHDANNGGLAGSPPTTSGPAATTSGPAAASGGTALTSTSEVPDGGGTIITGKNIVVTQPQAGIFKAFSAVCTHQGCIVSSVSGGTIDCPCHHSKFSIKDGSVVKGPAIQPLPPVAIKVEGTSILPG